MTLTGMQVRMARVALRWRVDDLAEHSGVQWARLQQIERADGAPSAYPEVMNALKLAFEKHGVEFLSGDESHQSYIKLKTDSNKVD
ncbi:helix-turn-helix domain-containing protein [Rhodospirillales bacterium]|nr:helix-turn-helix domain-containing protein [Rhodospirillales bacterium]